MNKNLLSTIAKKMVAKGKGILAADESTGSIEKRLSSINVKSTQNNRRDYRNLLLTTSNIEKYISGVILYDETFRQKADNGLTFPKLLIKRGILPGIKVDTGGKDLAFYPGEKVTEGLDGLRERFSEYKTLGASFAKWRAIITIGKNIPTEACLDANVHALVRYAALAQEADIVPIVEPEVLMDGDHDIARCEEVTLTVLKKLFEELVKYKVYLPGTILKPNMVISGTEAKKQATASEVAEVTLRVFKQSVPKEILGIVFLSGGLSPDEATERLFMINKLKDDVPWELSFSFGRALQSEALNAWGGMVNNFKAAQNIFENRAKLVSMARSGLI